MLQSDSWPRLGDLGVSMRGEPTQARIVQLPVGSAVIGGFIVGAVSGLVVGTVAGAVLSWMAGVALDWQQQLGYSLGVNQQLLPFGNQAESLAWIRDSWLLVIPGMGITGAVASGLIGALAGGLVAAVYNRMPARFKARVELL
mgnify:CR=1 FL=1